VNRLSVAGGTAYVDVPRLEKGDEYTFELPNRTIALSHSVHFRIDMDGMEARLAVFKGELNVGGAERVVDIRKGETLTLSFNDAQRYNLANTIAGLPYDAWDKDRDDTIREAGFNRNNQLYPYGYGYADLMNYGTFMNVGGFGSCWRPYGVGFDWDPFDYGYWSYYPGFGYTWVSGYPWGWAPYRYGGWNWASASGWSWCPRLNNVNNWYVWNVVPVVVNPPPRWHRPQPPDHPHVGLPPIIPVGRRGDGPYRGGLVSDKPPGNNGNNNNGGSPEPAERRGDRRDPGVDASHLNGGERGTPSVPTGRGPNVVVIPPEPITPSGSEDRGRISRPNRGIDLTPPSGGSPGGRGVPSAPIESPVQVMRSPGHSGPSQDRGPRIDASGSGGPRMEPSRSPASSGRSMDSSHMPSPAPSPRMDSPRMDSSPRMSAPSAAPAPSSGGGGGSGGSSGGGGGGSRSKPPSR
jgi:hypothetical protein